MSQPRKTRTRSRRASSERDTENSSEALLPDAEEAANKLKRRKSVKEVNRVSTRVKIKPAKLREAERETNYDSSDDSEPGNLKDDGSSVDETDGKPLVLDDLIDDFCDEELEDSGEVTDPDSGNIDESSQLVLELVDDSDDEVESEIAEEMSFKEASQGNKSTTCKQWKYGKLWEFIRDLLKIKKYNPSVIRWENVEEGEFRIVDSVVVAQLWATVRGNKRMNYEKLSRAMRYYYKYKIFQIVPSKRLVYKFGSRATGWKPRTSQTDENPDEDDPVLAGRVNLRCSKCLCVLESGAASQDHLQTCTHRIVLSEDESKKDGDKLRSHILSRPIPETDNSKPLRQKLREIKSKPLLTNEREILTPPRNSDGDKKETNSQSPEQEITEQSEESLISSLQTKTSSEQLALECLMSLGEERTSEPVRLSVTEPSFIPLTVTEINKQPNEMLPCPPNHAYPEAEAHVSLHIPEENASDSIARSYIVIPNFQAALKKQETINTPKAMSNITDKISFLKSAAEKSKTQTILQKRGHGITLNTSINDDSDDEIEIVKIIKTPAEERVNPFLTSQPAGTSRNIKINEKYIQRTLSASNLLESNQIQTKEDSLTPSTSRQNIEQLLSRENISIAEETLGNLLPCNVLQQSNSPRKIVINEKYLNMFKQGGSVMDQNISTVQAVDNLNAFENRKDSNRIIKVNEKYLQFLPNQSALNPLSHSSQISSNMQDLEEIQALNMQEQSEDIEMVEIVGQSSTERHNNIPQLIGLEIPERTIKMNPKYSNFIAGRTPEECGNIAGNDQEASTSSGTSKANENLPRIKINDKYASYVSKSNGDIQTITINSAYQSTSNITIDTNDQIAMEKYQQISNGPPNKTANSASTLTSKLRNTKISDIRAQKAEESQNLPLDLSSPLTLHSKRIMQESNEVNDTKRPKIDDSLRRNSDTVFSPTTVDTNPTNPFARRHSDNYAETNLVPMIFSPKPLIDNEPLPGLWKFLRSLLHNPKYNPKMVTWEILDDGMFRIHSLHDLYLLWKSIRQTPINYELLTKTLKLYDQRNILHSVSKHRCVYKFGGNSADWKPHESEISRAGKRPVPNQATWPFSRFYGDFNPKSTIAEPTTLFTLRPLDTGTSQFSELKVLSDNSRIVKTNDSPASIGSSGSEIVNHHAVEDVLGSEILIKTELHDEDDHKLNVSVKKEVVKKTENSNGMEISCKLTLPTSKNEKAILKLDGGFCLELDRSLFERFETTSKKDMPVLDYKPRIRTTIVHKDKSRPFKSARKKIISKKKFVKKIKPPVDGPITAAQLIDAVIPRKLNFLKPSTSSEPTDRSVKKFNFILPKPGPETLFSQNSSSKSEIKIPSTVANVSASTNENSQMILQPMYTLSYQTIPEKDQTNISIPASSMSTAVPLHVTEASSATNIMLEKEPKTETASAVRHKLPLIVTQRPSFYSAPRQISPRKEPVKQDQTIPSTSAGLPNQNV